MIYLYKYRYKLHKGLFALIMLITKLPGYPFVLLNFFTPLWAIGIALVSSIKRGPGNINKLSRTIETKLIVTAF